MQDELTSNLGFLVASLVSLVSYPKVSGHDHSVNLALFLPGTVPRYYYTIDLD
jgi:hypothetical protein